MTTTTSTVIEPLGYNVERPGWPIGTPRPPAYARDRGAQEVQTQELEARVLAMRTQIERLEADLAAAHTRERGLEQQLLDNGDTPLAELDDAVALQQVGIYRYHHPLENAEAYKERLNALDERIKHCIKSGAAIESSDRFVFNNSLAQGRRMVSELSKLMLRAYNAEADSCMRTMRAGNVATAKSRLNRTVTTISKLGTLMELRVADEFHQLRIEELELTADYLFRVQEERERAREDRARLREQKRDEQRLQEERARLDKERAHYENTLAELRRQGRDDEADDVERRLAEINGAIEATDYRIANQRAGYIYVISNLGAFGPGVIKIGLTRRLEPMERIHELASASVPFPFDVHVIYFADDAVTLENELHHHFAAKRLNLVNHRKEFFFATPDEVRAVLTEKVGNLLEYIATPEALQYNQSRHGWVDAVR